MELIFNINDGGLLWKLLGMHESISCATVSKRFRDCLKRGLNHAIPHELKILISSPHESTAHAHNMALIRLFTQLEISEKTFKVEESPSFLNIKCSLLEFGNCSYEVIHPDTGIIATGHGYHDTFGAWIL